MLGTEYFDKLIKKVHVREAEVIQAVQQYFDSMLDRIKEIKTKFQPLEVEKPREGIAAPTEHRAERRRSSIMDNFKMRFKSIDAEAKRNSVSESGGKRNSVFYDGGKRNSVIDEIRNKFKSSEQQDSLERLKRLKKVDLDKFEQDLNLLIGENEQGNVAGFTALDLDLRLRESKRRIDEMEKRLNKILTDNLLDKTTYELGPASFATACEENFGKLIIRKRGNFVKDINFSINVVAGLKLKLTLNQVEFNMLKGWNFFRICKRIFIKF